MFGSIKVVEQQAMTKFSQPAATAWSAVEGLGLVGASYKPMAFVGTQQVNGVNYVFIAEQTLIVANPERHIVIIKVNALDGKYTLVSIEQII